MGGIYRVSYYETDGTVGSDSGKTAKTHWDFATDAAGEIWYKPEYLVGGTESASNPLSRDPKDGDPGFPVGVVTVQEITPPGGYLIDSTVYKIYYRADADGRVRAFNADGKEAGRINAANDMTDLDIVSNEAPANSTVLLAKNGTKYGAPSATDSAVDTVAWVNYQSGTKLSIVSKLYDKTAKQYVELKNATGSDKTVIVTNVTSTGVAKQTKDVTFQFDSSALAGHTLTAVTIFNGVLNEGKTNEMVYQTFTHNADFKDADETIYYVGLETNLLSKNGKVGVSAEKDSAVDTISFKGVPKGRTITFDGVLYDVTSKKNVATASVTAISTGTAEQKIDMTFHFDSSALSGHTLSAKVTAVIDGVTHSTHNADYKDNAETICFPSVRTLATDSTYKGHVGVVAEKALLVEKSFLANLVKGETYEVRAVLADQISGDMLLVNGKTIEKTVTVTIDINGKVTAKDKAGNLYKTEVTRLEKDDMSMDLSVDIPFEYDSSVVAGKATVVYEDLLHKSIVVCSMRDKDEIGEQVHYYQLNIRKDGLDYPEQAAFSLAKDGKTLFFKKVKDGVYNVASFGEEMLHPAADGWIHIRGLEDSAYLLTEIKTEAGHNLLSETIEINFSAVSKENGLLKSVTAKAGKTVINLAKENEKLPNSYNVMIKNQNTVSLATGGEGNRAFYVVALFLLVGALACLSKGKIKKLLLVLALIVAGSSVVPSNVYAAEPEDDTEISSIIDERPMEITVMYSDDADGKMPVKGAGFKVALVAEMDDQGGYFLSDGRKISVDELTKEPVTYNETVVTFLGVESPLNKEVKTDSNGKLTFDGLTTAGIYAIVESNPTELHFASEPILVALPHVVKASNGVQGWSYEKTVYPKASLAGRLKVVKFVEGSSGDKNREWHFTVNLEATGSFSYEKSNGDKGTIKSGDTIALKHGESFTIDMIPAGSTYTVTELEANKEGYVTKMTGNAGRIERLCEEEAVFQNRKDDQPKTGDSFDVRILILASGSLFMIALLLVLKRNQKEE